jgi:carboxypeptidase family protein
MKFSGIPVLILVLLVSKILGAQNAPAPSANSNQAQAPTIPSSGTGSIRGTVKDGTGAVIPGARVTLTNSNNATRTVTTGRDGGYVFRGVPSGVYSVSTTFTGLQQQTPVAVNVSDGQSASANIVMSVQTQKQEVTVTDTVTNVISTEAANNQSALVLKPEDLDALPDDPDDLQADLQALAGPSAGPGGNQIYIDGFTGGRLPPKESIREIRINSNPFPRSSTSSATDGSKSLQNLDPTNFTDRDTTT